MIAYDHDNDRKFQIQSNPGDDASAFIRDRLAEAVTVYGLNLIQYWSAIMTTPAITAHSGWLENPRSLLGRNIFAPPLSPCDWKASSCPDRDFNPEYHMPTDSPDKIKIDLIVETSKAMIAIMAYAAEIQ